VVAGKFAPWTLAGRIHGLLAPVLAPGELVENLVAQRSIVAQKAVYLASVCKHLAWVVLVESAVVP
jgi:hypothetical protein